MQGIYFRLKNRVHIDGYTYHMSMIDHGTHTMCDKSNVFSGCSGNLGKLFFPFSGTHLKLFRKEWPICLLGDFYRTNRRRLVSRKRYILLFIYGKVWNFESSIQHVQNYCTPSFHDRYYVSQKLYRAKNNLDRAGTSDISDICIGSRWSFLCDTRHTWQDGPLKNCIWMKSSFTCTSCTFVCNTLKYYVSWLEY